MTIDDVVRSFRDRWVVIVAAAVLGAMLGIGYFFLTPTSYTATTTLYVYSQAGNSADAAYQGGLASQTRVSSYTALVTDTRVTQDVINRLGLRETPNQLARRISASNPNASVLINVSVTDHDAASAAIVCNAVAGSTIGVVNDLERPATADTAQQVSVRVVKPAEVPSNRTNPGLWVTIVVGALLGLAAGLVVAFVRGARDSSVRSITEFSRITGVPTIGGISYDPKIPSVSTAAVMTGRSGFAESVRTLRTNLEVVDDEHPRTLVFTSAVDGEGKTTTVVALAVALAATGRRVVLVDANLREPMIADRLQLERSVGLSSVLTGRATLGEALQRWGPGLPMVLTCGPTPPNPSELLASREATQLFETLRDRADYVLIDTPAVLPVTDAAVAAHSADAVILVARFGHTTEEQIQAAARTLDRASAHPIATIVTMLPPSHAATGASTDAISESTTASSSAAAAGPPAGWSVPSAGSDAPAKPPRRRPRLRAPAVGTTVRVPSSSSTQAGLVALANVPRSRSSTPSPRPGPGSKAGSADKAGSTDKTGSTDKPGPAKKGGPSGQPGPSAKDPAATDPATKDPAGKNSSGKPAGTGRSGTASPATTSSAGPPSPRPRSEETQEA